MTRDEFLVCRDYASMDLAFSLYSLHETLYSEYEDEESDIRELYGVPERGYFDWLVRLLKQLQESIAIDDSENEKPIGLDSAESELRELRREVKNRVEFLMILLDRLTVYEHVLNRCELRFEPEEKLDEFLKSNPENEFYRRFFEFVYGDGEKEASLDRLRYCISEIPTQMTRQKLFDMIDQTMTLYLDGDETSLDEFLYILRKAGLVCESKEFLGEYPALEKPILDFESVNLKEMSEKHYYELKDEFYQISGKLQYVMGYYTELQRCVNDTLSLCIVRKWLPVEEALIEEKVQKALSSCLSDEIDDSLFVSLEGVIEGTSEKLQRLMSRVEAPDMNAEEEEEYLDVATLARLLSNSLFAEIDPLFVETKIVTKELLHEKEELLFKEMTEVLKSVQKPVKKAIMSHLLEYLPPLFRDGKGLEEYVRLNLFGCRDKAEKCASMAILLDIFEGNA